MRPAVFVLLALGITAKLAAAEDATGDRAMELAARDYAQRMEAETQRLIAARVRIADERIPLAELQRELQEQVLSLEAEAARAEIAASQAGSRVTALQAEIEALNRNLTYVTTRGRDALKGFQDSLLPGEAAAIAGSTAELEQAFGDPAQAHNATLTLEAADRIMERVRMAIGGHVAPGSLMFDGDNELLPGRVLWMGPEVFFRSDRDGAVGSVRAVDGLSHPVALRLSLQDPQAMERLFAGEAGVYEADPTGGSALRLQDARGTWLDHLKKGGVIGYLILALGGLAALTTLLKLIDIRHVNADRPETIHHVLEHLKAGSVEDTRRTVVQLHPTARELFESGLLHLEKPKAVLEDNLYAVLLRQRMQLERRLPFLTVIVAAAPLLGLLGTVTGMVKTFTLITVFGTGNAAKLSSGISEALVTTELGLIVAIPTLIVHGYLNRRTQKILGLSERYAAEFVAAATEYNSTPAEAAALQS